MTVWREFYEDANKELIEVARAHGKARAILEGTIRSIDAYISVYLDFNLDKDNRTIQQLQARKEEIRQVIEILKMGNKYDI